MNDEVGLIFSETSELLHVDMLKYENMTNIGEYFAEKQAIEIKQIKDIENTTISKHINKNFINEI